MVWHFTVRLQYCGILAGGTGHTHELQGTCSCKTVSWTGEIVANLGGSKVIKSSAGHRMDRDLNGARGIFIKNVARALTVRPCTVNPGASKSLISSAT